MAITGHNFYELNDGIEQKSNQMMINQNKAKIT